ncbi:MAG: GTPase, partial [Erysipelotrichaceae bacterium]
MIKKCLGCGVTLQSTDDKKVGYIPLEKLANSAYCQRCFKLIHYAKKTVNKPNLDNQEIITLVNESKACVFFIVDLFNISNEIINTFKSIKVPKLLLVNKSDLIPRGVKLYYLKDNIKTVYNLTSNVTFISTKKDLSVSLFTNFLEDNKVTSGYILGYTNAGKSSLINKILKSNITTSSMPNTTLDLIEMKLDNYTLIDTPGFTLTNPFYAPDDWNLIKRINSSHTVKP